MEKIMLDYDDKSVITTYDQTSDKKEVFKGVEVRHSSTAAVLVMIYILRLHTHTETCHTLYDERLIVWRSPARWRRGPLQKASILFMVHACT